MTTTWHPLLQLLVVTLAAARVTVLLVNDVILAAPRDRLLAWSLNHGGEDGYPFTLLTCHWCMGWWVSLAWFVAWCRWPDGAALAAVPWAIATLVFWFGGSWLGDD